MSGWQESCIQCGEEFGTRSVTNFCSVCCHNGLDANLLDERGFFASESPEPDETENNIPTMAQTGLGDFA